MSGYLTRRDTIAVMVMQAMIIKREVLRLTPEQTALSALEHADALLETMGGKQIKTRNELRCAAHNGPISRFLTTHERKENRGPEPVTMRGPQRAHLTVSSDTQKEQHYLEQVAQNTPNPTIPR